jgi:hypothetical protein
MGIYNVVEMTYKKGLLKKLFDEEQKKQYLDSHIDDGKYHKATKFARGSGYGYWYKENNKTYDSDNEDEHKSILKYRFHIKTTEYPNKRSPDGHNSYGHQFIYYPEYSKLYIYNVGGRYNWGKEDDHCKNLIKYFSNILDQICPRTRIYEGFYSSEWSVRVTGDDCINEDTDDIDSYGDELTEDEVIYEIPEKLRTVLEQTRVISVFGSDIENNEHLTIEEAVFKGNYDYIEKYFKEKKDHEYDSEQKLLQELFYSCCKHKYTHCIELFIKYASIKPDNESLSIAVKNKDINTSRLLLLSNEKLLPYSDDIADAAFSWKNKESQSDLFYLLLDYFIKRHK